MSSTKRTYSMRLPPKRKMKQTNKQANKQNNQRFLLRLGGGGAHTKDYRHPAAVPVIYFIFQPGHRKCSGNTINDQQQKQTVKWFCLCCLACMAVVSCPITRGEQNAWKIRNGWGRGGEGWLGWARKGRNKISAEKLFVLLSRLEMKRLLHRLTPISEKHSPIRLQFLYFLSGKKHSLIIFTRASFQFSENKKEMRTQREFGKVPDIKDLS